jgi:threonine/homoserine/homoserine lactone efflux protein
MLPDTPLLIAFSIAALAVILSPGPDTVYVLSRSVGEGRLSGIVASLGISAGLCVHVAAASLGLSKLFDYAPVAFEVLRWAGVAYLLYLAWGAFRSDAAPLDVSAGPGRKQLRRAFSEAALTNLLNPKIIVFFIAFLPQFANPARGQVALQILLLGAMFILVGFCWLGGLALAFGYFGDWLKRSVRFWRWQRWIMGTSLGGIALWLALPARAR